MHIAAIAGDSFVPVDCNAMRSLTCPVVFIALACLAFLAPVVTAQTTGMFGKCDPVVHDKLAGAEWRSPSDCEVQFDAFVRPALTAALKPAIDDLIAHGWRVTRQVELQSLTSIPRHSETKPFQLTEQQMHQGGAFYVSLGLDKNSPIFAQYDTPIQAAMQKFGAALKSMNAADGEAAQKSLSEATKAETEHTTILVSVSINSGGVGISTFKGGHTVTTLPTGGFAVSAPYVQAPTGGDISAAQRVTYVFFGPFTQPGASGPGAGDEDIHVKGTLSSAPAKLLRVQNICVRIQTGTELAQQVISLIDWTALKKLIVEP
jgi:hypothetical protein